MNAEVTATTPSRTHLLRYEPRYSWCGWHMKAEKFVPDWHDVTCKLCLEAISYARRDMKL